jgi:hypothetical protein
MNRLFYIHLFFFGLLLSPCHSSNEMTLSSKDHQEREKRRQVAQVLEAYPKLNEKLGVLSEEQKYSFLLQGSFSEETTECDQITEHSKENHTTNISKGHLFVLHPFDTTKAHLKAIGGLFVEEMSIELRLHIVSLLQYASLEKIMALHNLRSENLNSQGFITLLKIFIKKPLEKIRAIQQFYAPHTPFIEREKIAHSLENIPSRTIIEYFDNNNNEGSLETKSYILLAQEIRYFYYLYTLK